jgi:glycosyltransferase involved in cell wall biosynthesis
MNTTKYPVISVIIPCYNAAAWIRTTLQSVFIQQGIDFEVIVVDDGSTDDGAAIVAREFPQVQLIRITNSGPSRARNIGTQAARGEFIQYLDADDLLAPGKLAAQLQALSDSGADVAYGNWQRLEEQADGSFLAGATVCRELPAEAEIGLFTDFWCPPAVYLFRRTIVERIGSWNECLPVIQDARFALDAALQGGRFVYVPQTMALYRAHRKHSVSRRDPRAFNRDVYTNAMEVEAWWRRHGGFSPARHAALLRVYGQVARASFRRDPATFESVYQRLMQLDPRYVPVEPRGLALLSRFFGYRRAEALAWRYRAVKAVFAMNRKARSG